MEWETKTICAFIGLQAQIDTEKTGGKNPLFEAAQDISIDPAPASGELEELRGAKVADSVEDDPRLSKPGENPAGSFEKFMAMFGPGGAARR